MMKTGDCRITDYRVFGNAVAYEMVCGTTSIHSKAAYHGDAFKADMTTKAKGAPEVVNHIKAHRLGACPPLLQPRRGRTARLYAAKNPPQRQDSEVGAPGRHFA